MCQQVLQLIEYIFVKLKFLAKLVECYEFTECSATCGNGTQTCERTCENGNFGNSRCPNDQQVKIRACNTDACRK